MKYKAIGSDPSRLFKSLFDQIKSVQYELVKLGYPVDHDSLDSELDAQFM